VAYYLGVDGGGSKTTCAVGDETSQLKIVTAGPSNITRVGSIRAREALHQAIRQACTAAKITPDQVRGTCIGIAGAGRLEVAAAVREMVAELISGAIEVVGDMEIALAAAFGAGPGVIVIAGTGSIAFGRDGRGGTARAGGWGFAISDEGSAHWIGRTSVSTLLRTIDQSSDEGKRAQAVVEDFLLFRKMKAAWKLHSLDEFVRTANSNPDFAALFPQILAAADAGDDGAQRVLMQAGDELAQLAAIVGHRLFGAKVTSLATVPLAVAGGVFKHSSRVRERFSNVVRKSEARFELNPQVVQPVTGALQMARAQSRAKS
jgi:glucosamine kinase